MKFHLSASVLLCALLSLSYANVNVTEQSLTQLEETPQNEDKAVVVDKTLVSAPQQMRDAADEPKEVKDEPKEGVNGAVEEASPQTPLTNNREAKQLVGFFPTYMLRQAVRLSQEQQPYDFRSLIYDDEEDADEIEEERAIRRRKRFRRRNTRGHLKKSRRHKNNNKRKLKSRKKVTQKKKAPKRSSQKRGSGSVRKGSKNKKKKINRYYDD